MHSDPQEVIEFPFGFHTFFSKGGVNRFTHTEKHSSHEESLFNIKKNDITNNINKLSNNKRDGWYGWMGLGGSIFQWHPELKIGFAYVPTNLMLFDFPNYRGSLLQELIVEAVKKNLLA